MQTSARELPTNEPPTNEPQPKPPPRPPPKSPRGLHDWGIAQWDLIRRLYELARLPVPHGKLALLRRVHKEVGARRRELPLTYRSSVYKLHIEEEDVGGGWFEVSHPTHPLNEAQTRLQPVNQHRDHECVLPEGQAHEVGRGDDRPQKASRVA